jgi:hypothetical protein
MAWLTPDSIPEDDDCRPLSIPADSVWLALVSGALTELTKPYNWQKFGTLTVQETVDKMQAIVDDYYASPCGSCTTPGGYRVIRINSDGHIEQLNSSGEWEASTDEYHLPLPDARSGGTADDQMCLAAKNAVNVLQQLYENISDSYNDGLDEAEAVTALIFAIVTIVGFEAAPITWGVTAFFAPIFSALYSALEFVFADLWDASVSAQITCFLRLCATNDAGVVTFDYACFNRQLNSLADSFSLTETQLRLYIQISYLLYFIGGIDGLNLAGATTAITDDDCSDCNCQGTSVDFTVSDQGFVTNAWGAYVAAGLYQTNIWGTGIYTETTGGANRIGVTGDVEEVCGTGININWQRGAVPGSATLQVRVTTTTQVKTATVPLSGLSGSTIVLWNEGGDIIPDGGVVDIGYTGTSGFGLVVKSFQTGNV